MDEKQLEAFRSLDWEDIAAKLLVAANIMAARYGWRRDKCLPGGKSLEDVVIETISDIWEKPERVNSSCSLTVQLKGIIKSKLWNLSQSADERTKRSEALVATAKARESGTASVDCKDECDYAIELLLAHPKVKKSAELELMVTAMSCGILDVVGLAKETGLQRDRIYQLQRELRVIYPSIAQQLQNGGCAS